jgi:hypothetical protein
MTGCPRARPDRGPDPLREGHRSRPLPVALVQINQAWLTVVMLAVDLIAWTQHLLHHGDLAKAELKTLRYRILHVAARLTRGQRRRWLRNQRSWPWAHDLAAAFGRLTTLPVLTGCPCISPRRAARATGRTSMPAASPHPSTETMTHAPPSTISRSAHAFMNDRS